MGILLIPIIFDRDDRLNLSVGENFPERRYYQKKELRISTPVRGLYKLSYTSGIHGILVFFIHNTDMRFQPIRKKR